MKTCFKCQETLPLSDFYPHPQMKDGHLNKCRACTRKDSADRVAKKEATDPEWMEKEAARQRAKTTKYREAKDIRVAARTAVRKAIISKALTILPCEVCGATKTEAHHDSYEPDQWLVIRWLCRLHHKMHHMALTVAKNTKLEKYVKRLNPKTNEGGEG